MCDVAWSSVEVYANIASVWDSSYCHALLSVVINLVRIGFQRV